MDVEVKITYTWKINSKDWKDLKSWAENNKFVDFTKTDPINMWYHLNQAVLPDVENITINK